MATSGKQQLGGLGGFHAGQSRTTVARRRHRLRLGLVVLAVATGVTGVWALFAPRSFFNDFPALGITWVSQFKRYSEHLTRDVGGYNLGFAALFVWAAVTVDRRVVRAATFSWLFVSVPHLIWHVFHLEPYSTSEAVSLVVVLGLGVVLPIALFSWAGRIEADGRTLGRFL